jgi:hypothetical protein
MGSGQVLQEARRWLMGCAVLSLLALTGCGDDGPQMGQVTGTITHKGAPVPCNIVFQPTDGRPSLGFADAQGKYTLQYLRGVPGAKVGQHRVFVTFSDTAGPEMELARAAGKATVSGDQAAILAKYGPDKSTLTLEVKPGPQELNIALD